MHTWLFSLVFSVAMAKSGSSSSGSAWSEVRSATSIALESVVVDPGDPNRWYALVGSNVMASYRGGDGWRRVTYGQQFEVLAVDSSAPGRLYAREPGRRVVQSDDGARTWKEVLDGAIVRVDGTWVLRHGAPWTTGDPNAYWAVDPSNPKILYRSDEQGISASEDGGQTWEARNAWLEYPSIRGLLVDPEQPQRLLALAGGGSGMHGNAVFESTNGGRVWRKWASDMGQASDLLFVRGDTVWAVGEEASLVRGTSEKVAKLNVTCGPMTRLGQYRFFCAAGDAIEVVDFSAEKGDRRKLQHTAIAVDVERLREFPDGRVLALLGSLGALARGLDGTWERFALMERASGEMPPLWDIASEVSGSDASLFASDSLYARRGSGEPDARSHESIRSILVDPGVATTVYAGTADGTILRSTDAGWTFSEVRLAAAKIPVLDLAADPSGSGTLWAATWGAGLRMSSDGGQNWVPAGRSHENTYTRRVVVDPVNPNTVWVAAWVNGLWKTDDAGRTWATMPTGCEVVYDVVIHPLRPEQTTIGCEDGRLLQSRDGGAHWSLVDAGVQGDVLALRHRADGSLLLGTDRAEVALEGDNQAFSTNKSEADYAAMNRGDRERWDRDREAERQAASKAAMEQAKAEKAAQQLVTESARLRSAPGRSISFADDGRVGVLAHEHHVYVTQDSGQIWHELPLPMFVKEGHGVHSAEISADGTTLFLAAGELGAEPRILVRRDVAGAPWNSPCTGKALTPEECGWSKLPLPSVTVSTCEPRMPRSTFYVDERANGLAVIVPEKGYLFYTPDPSATEPAWSGRFLCDGRLADLGEGNANLAALLGIWGFDTPKWAQKVANKEEEEARSVFALPDGRFLVYTHGQKLILSDGKTGLSAHALPPRTSWLSISEGTPTRLWITTDEGLRVSNDMGATWQQL